MNFISGQSEQKLRGGYYTPSWLCDFLAKWACRNARETVLEPSCGDGAFIASLSRLYPTVDIDAFEIDRGESSKASAVALLHPRGSASVRNGDFLEWAEGEIADGRRRYSAVVGNPPYIRYQYMSKETQDRVQRIASSLGLDFTRHANIWVPFVAVCIALCCPGGRLAMVVPAELLTVSHSARLRDFLVCECSSVHVVDPVDLWFPGTQQGAIALLCEKKPDKEWPFAGLSIATVSGTDFAKLDVEAVFRDSARIADLVAGEKWTRAMLSAQEDSAVAEAHLQPMVYPFAHVASTEVGIITGANDFFIVDTETVERYSLWPFAKPIIGKPSHARGLLFDEKDQKANASKGEGVWLVSFGGGELPPSAIDYIRQGEALELHERYKCRVRSPWYAVPSVRPNPISLTKRSHLGARLIFNASTVHTTDTFYRVAPRIDAALLVTSFINPLTALSVELGGRSYGGGVLELIPSEIGHLVVPVPETPDKTIADCNEEYLALGYDDYCIARGEALFKNTGVGTLAASRITDAWLRMRSRRLRA